MSTAPSPHWEQTWARGLAPRTSFDVGAPSGALVSELERRPAPRGGTAIVPGCGRAYDALHLVRSGYDRVVALDVAPSAAAAAESFLKEKATPDELAKIDVVCGDFFRFEGQFDFIWVCQPSGCEDGSRRRGGGGSPKNRVASQDCTFLCALDPSQREPWAKQMRTLLAPGGTLLSCVFPICATTAQEIDARPFSVRVGAA